MNTSKLLFSCNPSLKFQFFFKIYYIWFQKVEILQTKFNVDKTSTWFWQRSILTRQLQNYSDKTRFSPDLEERKIELENGKAQNKSKRGEMCAFYCIWGVSLIVATLSMSIIFRVIHPLGPVVIVSESETATDL
jgi:hypothetical protein